jgi:hypothetical protein
MAVMITESHVPLHWNRYHSGGEADLSGSWLPFDYLRIGVIITCPSMDQSAQLMVTIPIRHLSMVGQQPIRNPPPGRQS